MSLHILNIVRKKSASAVLLTLALLASACGSGGENGSGDQAAVSVGSIESGCAEVIDLSRLLSGAPHPSITSADMTAFAEGAASLQNAFADDRSTEVGDYLQLMSDVVGAAAEKANEESGLSPQQILLLLDFEKAGRAADFERLTPFADAFFASTDQCGGAYTTAVASGSSPTDGIVSSQNSQADTTTTKDTSAASDDTATTTVAGATETTAPDTQPAPPTGALEVDTSSVGSTATFFGIEMIVGEVWRTTLTPEAALTGTGEIGEQRATLVEIRLTSTLDRKFLSPTDFGWVDADGFRTVADAALLESGARWDLDINENESKSGFLVFEGDLGAPAGSALQWADGALAPANAMLGVGQTTPTYPVSLDFETFDVGEIPMPPTSFDCIPSYTVEVRSSQATLDYQQFSTKRAEETERIIILELAFRQGEQTGVHSQCETVRNLSNTHERIRLVLGNGDAVSPLVADNDSLKPDATSVKEFVFSVPATTTSYSLVDTEGAVFAEWTEITFPGF